MVKLSIIISILNRAHLFKYALEGNPNCIEIKNNLACAYFGLGDLEKAEQEFLEVIARDPTLSQPYFNLGKIYEKKGLCGKAESMYNKTLRLTPDAAQVYRALGYLYVSCLNDLGRGKSFLERYVRMETDIEKREEVLNLIHNLE